MLLLKAMLHNKPLGTFYEALVYAEKRNIQKKTFVPIFRKWLYFTPFRTLVYYNVFHRIFSLQKDLYHNITRYMLSVYMVYIYVSWFNKTFLTFTKHTFCLYQQCLIHITLMHILWLILILMIIH